MSRAAVEDEFDLFFDEMIDFAKQEMSPTRTMGGFSLQAADDTIKEVMGDHIGESMEEIQEDMQQQRDAVIDYAEDLAAGADPAAARGQYEDTFLQTNPVYKNYEGPREDELRTELLGHLDEVAEDLAPIIDAPEDNFWDAMTATVPTYEEARNLLNKHFSQAETFRDYQSGIDMEDEVEVGKSIFTKTFTVDYTDEAIRVIEEGEAHLRRQVDEQLQDAYDAA